MAYAYWKAAKTSDRAVFDLFFRKNPFRGEYTIFAGLEECLKFLENFSFSESGKEALKALLPLTLLNVFRHFLLEHGFAGYC